MCPFQDSLIAVAPHVYTRAPQASTEEEEDGPCETCGRLISIRDLVKHEVGRLVLN